MMNEPTVTISEARYDALRMVEETIQRRNRNSQDGIHEISIHEWKRLQAMEEDAEKWRDACSDVEILYAPFHPNGREILDELRKQIAELKADTQLGALVRAMPSGYSLDVVKNYETGELTWSTWLNQGLMTARHPLQQTFTTPEDALRSIRCEPEP